MSWFLVSLPFSTVDVDKHFGSFENETKQTARYFILFEGNVQFAMFFTPCATQEVELKDLMKTTRDESQKGDRKR